MELVNLTLYKNSDFHIGENLRYSRVNIAKKSYMKIVMDFVEGAVGGQ